MLGTSATKRGPTCCILAIYHDSCMTGKMPSKLQPKRKLWTDENMLGADKNAKVKKTQQEGKNGKKKARASTKKQLEILEKIFEALSISKQLSTESEDESDAQCPKCGLLYGEDDSMWVCCDGCSTCVA